MTLLLLTPQQAVSALEAASIGSPALNAALEVLFFVPTPLKPSIKLGTTVGTVTVTYISTAGKKTTGTSAAPAYTSDLNLALGLAERVGVDPLMILPAAIAAAYRKPAAPTQTTAAYLALRVCVEIVRAKATS